ncbi:MAG TPA: hypothetical protein ENI23_15175 [bacterium]|nr:hypothetical protein [bacterium]
MDKINPEKMDAASNKLRDILRLITSYNRMWLEMTPQEKAAIGGIVFNLVSIWDNFSLYGCVIDKPVAGALLDELANFYNKSNMPQSSSVLPPLPSKVPPLIPPKPGSKKRLVN